MGKPFLPLSGFTGGTYTVLSMSDNYSALEQADRLQLYCSIKDSLCELLLGL